MNVEVEAFARGGIITGEVGSEFVHLIWDVVRKSQWGVFAVIADVPV